MSEEETYENTSTIEIVNNRDDYYLVESLTDLYIYSILEQDTETLLNIIDKTYIYNNNLSENNVISNLNDFADTENENIEKYKIMIDKMYVSKQGTINTYFIYFKIINRADETITETAIMAELDLFNETYFILPFEYMKENEYTEVQEGEKYKYNIESIESNGYNEYSYQNISEYEIILDLMSNLTDEILYDLDNSYNLFSDEYKKARFDTLDKYKDYIKKDIKRIYASSIENYRIDKNSDYTEYICIDQNGNYYIFKETAIMQYTVEFDTYTIQSQETINRYNNAENYEKGAMNINKVFQAINTKDFSYIYTKLDETFKNNNFINVDSLEQYLTNNLYDINIVEYNDYEEAGNGIFIYNIEVKPSEDSEESKEMTIVIKLEDETNFVMSFNIK